MIRITRWKVVAVTATTAVLAGGALGVTNVLAGPTTSPEPIRLQAIDVVRQVPQPTDDVLTPLSVVTDASTSSLTSPISGASVSAPTADSIVSPDSPVTQQSTETAQTAPTTSPSTSTPSPAPTPSPGSASSVASAESPSSVSSVSSADS